MKTVAFIPIRLNSKRVAGKNLKLLGGKPLMCWILETLAQTEGIDEIYVYCSDDAVKQYLPDGVSFMRRPVSLDQDETLGAEIYDAFTHAIDADIYLLAHTTSPFITRNTISSALTKVEEEGYDSAFSAKRIQTFAWYDGHPLNYSLDNIPRTQTIKPVFEETSGFYIFRREVWLQHHQRIGFNPYIAVVDDIEGVDIDWPEDFKFAERIIDFHESTNR